MRRTSLFHAPATRWAASATHLALSVLVIGSIALFAFFQWYPAGLHHAAKLDKLLSIMLAVDIVTGPLLTLILYRRSKKGLSIDLATISVLQLAFLVYGLASLWHRRPLFLVGSQQAFALVFATELPPEAQTLAESEHWPRFDGSGPYLAAVDLSQCVARDVFLTSYEEGNAGLLLASTLYQPYSLLRQQIAASASAVAEDLPSPAGTNRATLRSLELMSTRSNQAVILLDAASGAPLRVTLKQAPAGSEAKP